MRSRSFAPIPTLLLATTLALTAASARAQFIAFESGPVRPIALNSDGSRIYVVNTPDNRLEVFAAESFGMVPQASVEVGLEPVAVALRNDGEAWVVNHLSDSISVVDLAASPPRVVRTLLVGDEPRDIVFSGNGRAFVTTAHRGQHRTHPSIAAAFDDNDGDPELASASVPRADVWVFDGANPGASVGGNPLEVVELFGDTPRALAVSPDGGTVYAAVFHSGNQTAVVNEGRVCDGFASAGACAGDGITSPNGLAAGQLPGGNPGPDRTEPTSPDPGVLAPEVGLIVQFDNASGEWRDELGRNWSNGVRFHLPDHDVFAIDATTLNQTADFEHVGTILFNMVVNPVNGNLYVSNTEAQNLTRFEGPGGGGSTVQGNLAQSRITVIAPGTNSVEPRHLNRHIDYAALPAAAGVKDASLATPLQGVVSSNGATLYLTAFGSSKVGVFDTADLENDALWTTPYPGGFDPAVESANYVSVSGGGPAGLALDESRARLYVFTRFDNGVSIVDTATGSETAHVRFHNPEPSSVTAGRPVLYDAVQTSSNGEASCSSCHVFGDFDSLAWDLGDPDGEVGTNPNTINLEAGAGDQNGGADNDEFHPMKGAMTTQTLRGMATSGHMHWRGDRADGFFGLDAPDNDDEDLSFRNFIVAFPGLVGLDVALVPNDPTPSPEQQALEADMQAFSDFQLQVLLPPNPIRNLDNSMSSDQLPGNDIQNGRDFYFGDHGGNDCSDGVCIFGSEGTFGFSCNGCHALDASQGFFGTDGKSSFENEEQIFKIPHLRNAYQKVGMFGMPDVSFNLPGDNSHQGDQVRGTGFLHDGSTDTLFRFFTADVFEDNPAFNAGFDGVGAAGGDPDQQRRNMEAFMLAFDTDLAPAVGQQVTLDDGNGGTVGSRIDLLVARAEAGFTSAVLGGAVKECELVVRGVIGGLPRGWLYDPANDVFEPDQAGGAMLSDASLRALAATPGQALTYTCAVPTTGVRMALDRDLDGALDFDERQAVTDPANPGSIPGACNDGVDNDGDGDTDTADAGCNGNPNRNIENPQCSDGMDNDGDGAVDLADAECPNAANNSERPSSACGLFGIEAVLLLAPFAAFRRRRQL